LNQEGIMAEGPGWNLDDENQLMTEVRLALVQDEE
jgi:hypothetical protein